jgi:hypothetical protein
MLGANGECQTSCLQVFRRLILWQITYNIALGIADYIETDDCIRGVSCMEQFGVTRRGNQRWNRKK